MKLHEYQAKQLLAAYGVPVPENYVASSGAEAAAAAERLGGTGVVKAQVHAGGQGQGRRREGRGQPCGSRAVRRLAHRVDARDLPDRPAGGPRPPGARRTDDGYRARALPQHHYGWRTAPSRRHRVRGGRHGDRGGRADRTREGADGAHRPRHRIPALPGTQAGSGTRPFLPRWYVPSPHSWTHATAPTWRRTPG